MKVQLIMPGCLVAGVVLAPSIEFSVVPFEHGTALVLVMVKGYCYYEV